MTKNLSLPLILLSILLFQCSDPCDEIDCGPNGNCIEGVCNCDPGYSGTNCEINICDNVNCNNGQCDPVTGACNCDDGYEGEFCDTEIRAKYLGIYSGDISNCFEGLGQQVPAEFSMISAIVSADANNINEVTISSNNPLLSGQTITVDPTAGTFIIPLTSTTIENEQLPFPITITVTGDGEWTDDNTLLINLNVIIPLVPPISCTITMTK